jgi:formylglycine-generating enzyme required for sulfatase activity
MLKSRLYLPFLWAIPFFLAFLPANSLSQTILKRNAPKGMAFIPGDTFWMGTDPVKVPDLLRMFNVRRVEIFNDELRNHTVTIDAFYLDKYEVTNDRFAAFIKKHREWRKENIPAYLHNGKYLQNWDGDSYPKKNGAYPVVFVSWYSAVAYCQAQGKRLPTEAEWEFAARGGLVGKQFPWGDEPADRSRANYSASGLGAVTKVGGYPPNGYGLYDMAGNAWEYLTDEWAKYQTEATSARNPVAGGDLFASGNSYLNIKTRRVIRGGSWGGAPINLRVTYRDSHPPDGAGDHVGFRCAMSTR